MVGALTRSPHVTADEFLDWVSRLPGGERYELEAGEVVPMSPERANHTRIKYRIWSALSAALDSAGLVNCEVFGDGLGVRIDDTTVYQPDCLIRCGVRLGGSELNVHDPILIVEVVSPTSQARDTSEKLEAYLGLQSVRHYLVVNSNRQGVIVHSRRNDGGIETQIVTSGTLHLDPPGRKVDIASFYPAR